MMVSSLRRRNFVHTYYQINKKLKHFLDLKVLRKMIMFFMIKFVHIKIHFYISNLCNNNNMTLGISLVYNFV